MQSFMGCHDAAGQQQPSERALGQAVKKARGCFVPKSACLMTSELTISSLEEKSMP